MKHVVPIPSAPLAFALTHLGAGRLARALALISLCVVLTGCNQRNAAAKKPVTLVRTEVVQIAERRSSLTLTGEVQARVQADLSFRVSGRVVERLVDVGTHVAAGDVLARINPAEQQADLDAATAAVSAAQSQVRVANANFDRQKMLLSNGFTTRAAYDQAQESLRTAEGSLEGAQAQLGTAKEALAYTELRANAAGVITAVNVEVGQVAQAAQSAFALAHDGARDAVFDVYESLFFRQFEGKKVQLALVSDPSVTAQGDVREISPTIDPKTATVRVKIAIDDPPAAMTLGSAVSGTASLKPEPRITLPWNALTAAGAKPAVWVVDPRTTTVSLRPVGVETYETGAFVVSAGLVPGDRVVVDGGKFLSPGQAVTLDDEGGQGDRS